MNIHWITGLGILLIAVGTLLSVYGQQLINTKNTTKSEANIISEVRRQEDKIVDKLNDSSNKIMETINAKDELQPSEELRLRKLSYLQYKDEEYIEAIKTIDNAIENSPSYKNHYLRAIIYDKLYITFEFTEYLKKENKYPNKWYTLAMKDYNKSIELNNNENNEMKQDAYRKIVFLMSHKGFDLKTSDDKTKQKEGLELLSKANEYISNMTIENPNEQRNLKLKKYVDWCINYKPLELDDFITVNIKEN